MMNKSLEWQVSPGSQVEELLGRVKIEDQEKGRILSDAIEILGKCGDPTNEINNITGLVIGYVQSGKTLSYTTTASLSSQNGFNAIIIIAGSTTKLVDQTTERLAKDLDIDSHSEIAWNLYKNPIKNQKKEISARMEVSLFEEKPVLLITVMKNIYHLRNLNSLFETKEIKSLNLKVLIIDDEADQASLNTNANNNLENEVSAIYNSLVRLRTNIKNHSYLQYTATPQGPLLISLLDILSPDFVKILDPGEKYTGGKYFFSKDKTTNKYSNLKIIPEKEIPNKKYKLDQIPKSLEEALIYFYLTVLIGVVNKEHPKTHNRTMMVHPSQYKEIHSKYERWINLKRNLWLDELNSNSTDSDRQVLLNKIFAIYEKEIKQFDSKLTNQHIIEKIEPVIKMTPVIVINSEENNQINWSSDYARILIGGQVLDRGFTVEGLNVTYMPRNLGVGNADTIQQRCRFFGYKKDYINLCKVYISLDSVRAYEDYVFHEEDLRKKLRSYSETEKSLKDFKREFFLSPNLRLTRKNIISNDIKAYKLVGWKTFTRIDKNYQLNDKIISEFVKSIKLEESYNSGQTEKQIHFEADISSKRIVEDLLIKLKYKDISNLILMNNLLSLISLSYANNSNKIKVILMSQGSERIRRLTKDEDEILQLFQGENRSTNYLGDKYVKSENQITIQIHYIKIRNTNTSFNTLAFHIPEIFSKNLYTQNRI